MDKQFDPVGAAEIGRMLGVGRQRVDQLTRRKDFPPPLKHLAMGTVWNATQVRQWARDQGRQLHEGTPPPRRKAESS